MSSATPKGNRCSSRSCLRGRTRREEKAPIRRGEFAADSSCRRGSGGGHREHSRGFVRRTGREELLEIASLNGAGEFSRAAQLERLLPQREGSPPGGFLLRLRRGWRSSYFRASADKGDGSRFFACNATFFCHMFLLGAMSSNASMAHTRGRGSDVAAAEHRSRGASKTTGAGQAHPPSARRTAMRRTPKEARGAPFAPGCEFATGFSPGAFRGMRPSRGNGALAELKDGAKPRRMQRCVLHGLVGVEAWLTGRARRSSKGDTAVHGVQPRSRRRSERRRAPRACAGSFYATGPRVHAGREGASVEGF